MKNPCFSKCYRIDIHLYSQYPVVSATPSILLRDFGLALRAESGAHNRVSRTGSARGPVNVKGGAHRQELLHFATSASLGRRRMPLLTSYAGSPRPYPLEGVV